jgi:hypothetical protein
MQHRNQYQASAETLMLQASLFSQPHLFLFPNEKPIIFPTENTYEEKVYNCEHLSFD